MQCNAGEALGEFLHGQLAATRRRVVQEHPIAVETFQDQEMVPFPEEDLWKRHAHEVLCVHATADALDPIVSGSTREARGRRAITVHRASTAQLVQVNPAPEIGEHAAEACGPTFGHVHLQHQRSHHSALARRVGRRRP